jgi:GTP-binding protein HflX
MQRRARKRSKALSVSIVGYTNAGKSTLFNRLTHESIYAEDKLFATLDTTSRKLFVQPGHSFVISDTVGFIKNLPTTLIEAFKSTLEEVTQSNLLIHVVDVSNENRSEQIKEVEKILREIEAHELPQILVLNQIDKINIKTSCERDDYGKINHIQLSAKTGDGIEFLKQAMVEYNQTQINQRNGYYA